MRQEKKGVRAAHAREVGVILSFVVICQGEEGKEVREKKVHEISFLLRGISGIGSYSFILGRGKEFATTSLSPGRGPGTAG